MRCGFYPGSFDPPTLGHRDIMRRALKIFDRLVAGVGVHPTKAPMFTDSDRVAMLKEELDSIGAGGSRRGFAVPGPDGGCRTTSLGRNVIVRGLRDGGDFNYEMQMSGMNAQLAPDIETVFRRRVTWNRAYYWNACPADSEPGGRCVGLCFPGGSLP